MPAIQNKFFNGNTAYLIPEEYIFSVSELSNSIKLTVEKNFDSLNVRGEVSGLKIHSSGHIYLSLKDKDAVINAICWRGTKLEFKLEEGMEIIAKGRVTTYPSRSSYQFIIEKASIAGEGVLLKLINERRKKFEEMGYFNKSNAIPKYPETIGIVTSKTGAVLQDMLHRLRDRYQFCTVIIWPVNVQGTVAAEQISNAIRGFNFMTEKRPDVLIVARGGGSIEDLFPFNEEVVIKAVYESKIPVISAIGHETDVTLIDYAADLRAPTPTAAIEFSTPVLSEIKNQILTNRERINNSMKRILQEHRNILTILSKSIITSKFSILAISQRFDDITNKFSQLIKIFLEHEKLKLQKQKIISLSNYIAFKKHTFNSSILYFDKVVKNYLSKYKYQLEVASNRLEQSSYKKILEKGFCFITNSIGKTIKTKIEFESSDRKDLSVNFFDGSTKL